MSSNRIVGGISMAGRPKVFVTREIPKVALKLLEQSCDVMLRRTNLIPYDEDFLSQTDAVIVAHHTDYSRDCCEVSQWAKRTPVPRVELLKGVGSRSALLCLLTDKIDAELLDAGPNLKVISTVSVGYDHIDVKECRKRGILLGHTPDVLTEATAELTIALLLATSRKLFQANKAVFDGSWGPWDPMWMCGQGIIGNTVGIVGLGRIGMSVAEKLVPFKPRGILYFNRTANSQADRIGAKLVSLTELLNKSDFVVVCCALNDSTKEMFNRERFAEMKPNCIFINTSRGGVVDQEALYWALTTGKIAAAGLDVCTPEPIPVDHKLLTLANLTMLPHIASATVEAREQMALLAVRNVLAGLQGLPLPAAIPDS